MTEGENLGAGCRAGAEIRLARALVGMDKRFHRRRETGIAGGILLHRDDVFAVGIQREHQAGVDELAVHRDGAGAALADAAAFLGPGYAKILDQHVEQRPIGFHRRGPPFAVNPQLNLMLHFTGAPLPLRARAMTCSSPWRTSMATTFRRY